MPVQIHLSMAAHLISSACPVICLNPFNLLAAAPLSYIHDPFFSWNGRNFSVWRLPVIQCLEPNRIEIDDEKNSSLMNMEWRTAQSLGISSVSLRLFGM
jgi:hypothetical protein